MDDVRVAVRLQKVEPVVLGVRLSIVFQIYDDSKIQLNFGKIAFLPFMDT